MSLVQHIKDEKILSPVVCRICATEQNECVNDLLTSIHNGLYFIDMLQYCLQRSIDKDSRFSLSICLECTSNLIIAYNFNVLCNDSEQRFIKEMLDYHVECDSLERKVEVIIDESGNDVKPSHFVDCAVIEIPKRICDTSEANNRYDIETDTETVNVSIESNTHRKLKNTRASRYECYRCKATFRRIDYLRQHITYHYSDKELWKCSECEKRFTQRKSLLKHLYKHTNAACEYCNVSFVTLRDLKQHCVRRHSDQLITYKCDLCPRKFILKAQLVIHMHNHDTSQQYNCNVCNETFSTELQLKGHIRAVHTSFLCSECGKTFKNNSLLTSHQKVHNSDRPFVCSKCPSRFKWKVALTYHMTIHQTERKHVCETCGLSFTTRSAMKGHMSEYFFFVFLNKDYTRKQWKCPRHPESDGRIQKNVSLCNFWDISIC